jgi:glycosyltransferase involved in cell wall biosynthesis
VFTGSVPFAEVAAHYSLIDLFVVPRVDERAGRLVSPMKPFEAMAMRVPVLVSDLPALVEIARGSGCATFEAGSPESLAAVAGELLDHPDRLAEQVEEAARWVAAERTWEANGRAFAQAYAEARTNQQARQGRG